MSGAPLGAPLFFGGVKDRQRQNPFGSSGHVGSDRIWFVAANAVHRLWPTTSEKLLFFYKSKALLAERMC